MPEATKFTALGAGNGFNNCLLKQNVLVRIEGQGEYFKWTTLSGFNKDSGGMPTREQIDKSLSNLMALFWNIYSIKGSANATTVSSEGDSYSASVVDVPALREPSELVCFNQNYEDLTDYAEDDDFLYTAEASMGWQLRPTKLYKGETTDEANFIGYGLTDEVDIYNRAFRSIAGQINFPFVFVSLSSLQFQDTDNVTNLDSAYVELNGFHFVSYVQQPTNPDASSLLASVTFDNSPNDPSTYSASIEELEFYTYPA